MTSIGENLLKYLKWGNDMTPLARQNEHHSFQHESLVLLIHQMAGGNIGLQIHDQVYLCPHAHTKSWKAKTFVLNIGLSLCYVITYFFQEK